MVLLSKEETLKKEILPSSWHRKSILLPALMVDNGHTWDNRKHWLLSAWLIQRVCSHQFLVFWIRMRRTKVHWSVKHEFCTDLMFHKMYFPLSKGLIMIKVKTLTTNTDHLENTRCESKSHSTHINSYNNLSWQVTKLHEVASIYCTVFTCGTI